MFQVMKLTICIFITVLLGDLQPSSSFRLGAFRRGLLKGFREGLLANENSATLDANNNSSLFSNATRYTFKRGLLRGFREGLLANQPENSATLGADNSLDDMGFEPISSDSHLGTETSSNSSKAVNLVPSAIEDIFVDSEKSLKILNDNSVQLIPEIFLNRTRRSVVKTSRKNGISPSRKSPLRKRRQNLDNTSFRTQARNKVLEEMRIYASIDYNEPNTFEHDNFTEVETNPVYQSPFANIDTQLQEEPRETVPFVDDFYAQNSKFGINEPIEVVQTSPLPVKNKPVSAIPFVRNQLFRQRFSRRRPLIQKGTLLHAYRTLIHRYFSDEDSSDD